MNEGVVREGERKAEESRRARGGRRAWGERVVLAVACALVVGFYGWTVWSSGEPWRWGREQKDYYNLLIDGWQAGQLHMKVDVPEALLRLRDPYDPAERPAGLGLHDASFYGGKYYVYFGVAPVVTVMWPFRAVTGVDLPLPAAVLAFVTAGFLMSVGMLGEVRRRFFADGSAWVWAAAIVVLGVVSPVTVLLRRPEIWELPIAGGYFFAMTALWGVWRSVAAEGGRGRRWWLAGAGLALGLAVASRPTYLFATPMLAVPWMAWWWRERKVPWREAVAAVVPLAAIGAGLAWHNQARFGNPLEFGQAYQLSLDYESKLPHFAARYVPYNVAQHFFGAARGERYFPFLRAPEIVPAPEGYTQHRGEVFGVLANYPVAWLALLAPLAGWRRSAGERGAVSGWVGAVGVLFLGTATVMLAFFSALTRYQVDFVPAWMVLAVVGMLAGERWGRGWEQGARWRRRIAVSGMISLAAWSAVVAGLVSLEVDGLLRERNGALREAVARRLNWVPALVERAAGVNHGPVQMTVRMSGGPAGREETLVAGGDGPLRDRVFIRREADGRVRVGIQHDGAPSRLSEPLTWPAGERKRVWVTLGSLYPPATHPFFRGWSASSVQARRRRAGVAVEGRVVVEGYYRFVQDGRVRMGQEAGFTGEVEAEARGLAEEHEFFARPAEPVTTSESVRLRVRLPDGKAGAREPLVVTGRTGAADFVYVEYLDAGRVRFGFDHWNGPGLVSEPVPVDFAAEQAIEITMGSLATVPNAEDAPAWRRGRLRVAVNGAPVLATEAELYVAEPGEVWLALNPVGGTSCAERFTGEILSSERGNR